MTETAGRQHRDVQQREGDQSGVATRWSHPRWHGVVIFVLRICVIGFFLSMMLQILSGAMFVSGDVELLSWHELNANSLLSGFLFVAAPAALLLWKPAGGPSGPFWWTLVLIGATEAIKIIGFNRMIGLHIGSAVLTFGVVVLYTAWAFRYRHEPAKRAAAKRARKLARKGGAAA